MEEIVLPVLVLLQDGSLVVMLLMQLHALTRISLM